MGVCGCGSPVLAVDARSARTSQAGHRLTEMFFTCLRVRLWFLSGGPDYKSHGGYICMYICICVYIFVYICYVTGSDASSKPRVEVEVLSSLLS